MGGGGMGGGDYGHGSTIGKKILMKSRPCGTLNVTVISGRLQTHLFISRRNRTECSTQSFRCLVLMMKRKT